MVMTNKGKVKKKYLHNFSVLQYLQLQSKDDNTSQGCCVNVYTMHLEQCLTHCLLNYTEKTTNGTCSAEFQIRAGLNVIVQMLFC